MAALTRRLPVPDGASPHLTFPCRGSCQRIGPAACAQQLADHLGVQDGAAAGDPADRLDELADICDPVLEQVADAARGSGEQLGRGPGLATAPRARRMPKSGRLAGCLAGGLVRRPERPAESMA
jgi:hypothetical protein